MEGVATQRKLAGWLSQYIARSGACSRRQAPELVRQGRVLVNGRIPSSVATTVKSSDVVSLDGKVLQLPKVRLWKFYKPKGLVVSHADELNRTSVFDFIAKNHKDVPRVISAGRLDYNSEGLLLLTNSGGLARILEHPTSRLDRVYKVRVHGKLEVAMLWEMAKGMQVDGVTYAPITAVPLQEERMSTPAEHRQHKNVWLQMILTEGKNREIRNIFEHFGLQVDRLIRTSFGPFSLGLLRPGQLVEEPLNWKSLPPSLSHFGEH